MAAYTVGIDLGTSHTVVAWADTARPDRVQCLDIEQWWGPGQTGHSPLLPSVRYHPAPGELALPVPGPLWATPLDGEGGADAAVLGRWAQALGEQVPGRLVSSAKSWLSHTGVDRTAPILPWGAPADVPKVSPLQASASYLAHVRAVWDARFPGAPLAEQDLSLTVPASFDQAARALTLEAAQWAGLGSVHLLEEPQAAMHDWLWRHRHDRDQALAGVRTVLVVDVGGGTTDLSLLQIDAAPSGLALTRTAVGDHLMLGGDNMDLALAHRVEQRLAGATPWSATRFSQWVQRCRLAKETLLSPSAPEQFGLALLGAGQRLVGGSQRVTLDRDEVRAWLLEGFLPWEDCPAPPRPRRSGMVEFGLPYAVEPAISRHIAAFLRRHATVFPAGTPAPLGFAVPDALLLNGGVFQGPVFAQRLFALLSHWRGAPLVQLDHPDPALAVARGAVVHALWRAGHAGHAAIGGGSPRAYFLSLAVQGTAVPEAVCVLPRGAAEDQWLPLQGQRFALRLGQAVRFHVGSDAGAHGHGLGQRVPLASLDWLPLPSVVVRLAAHERPREVDVHLETRLTEWGTLEMRAVACHDPAQTWSLAFDVRARATALPPESPGLPHPHWAQVVSALDRVFGDVAQAVDPREVRQLRATLERILGPRQDWSLPVLRALFDALWARVKRRRRSAEHERVWLHLAGYAVRPGAGAPLDGERIEALWGLYAEGLQFGAQGQNAVAWWTLWRRAAVGLDGVAQLELLQTAGQHLEHSVGIRDRHHPLKACHGDLLRLVAALERVPALYRAELGQWLLQRLQAAQEPDSAWWVLGRLGARMSWSGQAQNVVPPEEVLPWLEVLWAQNWRKKDHVAFATVQIVRFTADRARDVPPFWRDRILGRLQEQQAPVLWQRMLQEVVPLASAEADLSYGETLPVGLRGLSVDSP